MRAGSFGAGLAAWAGALLSSLCCLLPLTVIVLGLGSGAFRERRRCDALACQMAGRRVTLALLIRFFPG